MLDKLESITAKDTLTFRQNILKKTTIEKLTKEKNILAVFLKKKSQLNKEPNGFTNVSSTINMEIQKRKHVKDWLKKVADSST